MFKHQREMQCLDLPASSIFQLQRSLNRVQVALPGFPPQEAEAFLVLYAAGQGVRAAIVFHLQGSNALAVYLKVPGPVDPQYLDRLMDEGIAFAESMGFLLGSLDFPLLSDSEKAALWESLPLRIGLEAREAPGKGLGGKAAERTPPVSGKRNAPPEEMTPASPKPAVPADKAAPAIEPAMRDVPPPSSIPPEPAQAEGRAQVSPALPAVGMPEVPLPRTLRTPRRPPTAEEIAGKRKRLRETLGKVLGSL